MDVETHPFSPFLPANSRLLMLGTFPPAPRRWCMDWYYPNFTNDMWRIFGICFFDDKLHFVDASQRTFRKEDLQAFLADLGVAVYDVAVRVCRTKGTASDKDLEIVEPTNLCALLDALPQCDAVLTAGQLATQVFASHFHIAELPAMGCSVPFNYGERKLRLYRQPSSSRAYPMKVEKKAEYYGQMFGEIFNKKG